MKCIYRRELLFREELSTALEAEESFEDLDDTMRGMEDEKGWDGLVGIFRMTKAFKMLMVTMFLFRLLCRCV